MNFNDVSFIKAHKVFDDRNRTYAPLFRKKFSIDTEINTATLYVCGLGYGYFYLNGKPVSEDLFTAPVGDYQKTVWYNVYDVTKLLQQGNNVFAAELGNGWYNEAMKTVWDQNEYGVRDVPKLKMALIVNGETVIESDESFQCAKTSAVTYNQLRTGEVFDARLFDENWNTLNFDDTGWESAIKDLNPPKGVMRECKCEPIREFEEIAPTEIIPLDDGSFVFDFGINMSGYARLSVTQEAGDEITLRYGEELRKDNTVVNPVFQEWFEDPFQTDVVICNGKPLTRTPKFTYHGFRFVHVTGLKEAKKDTLTAIFVHQAIERRTTFNCSDENLNKLFSAGIQATYSNIFYMPTDCPTREKYGWMNDAQSSIEQFMTNFEAEKVLSKWWQDIADSMLPSGMISAVVPPYQRAYEWGNGPVSEGTLFEIPYRVYLHTGDSMLLTQGLPVLEKSLNFWKTMIAEKGEIDYGLWDWEPPIREDYVSHTVINDIFFVKYLRIVKLARTLKGLDISEIETDIAFHTKRVKDKYIGENGECVINKQTAVAMLIYFDLFDELAPLANQLKRLVEEKDFHHDCGMVGIRYLYIALNKANLQEYGYKILTARGLPSYIDWLEDGATTLYEFWNFSDEKCSKNHHMFSDFMSWMMKTMAGFTQKRNSAGFKEVEICPYFFLDLDYVHATANTVNGEVKINWERKKDEIALTVTMPKGMKGTFRETILHEGENTFTVKGTE